jgi:SecD/SecF fusion protein
MADTVTYWPWYVTLAALGLVLVVPVWLGQSLARRWRMPDYAGKFSFILFTLFAGVVISYYGWSTNHIQLGIDLKGGSYLVYQLLERESAKYEKDTEQPGGGGRRTASGERGAVDMDKLVAALRRRVDPSGVLGVKIRAYGARQIEIKVPQLDQEQVNRLKRLLASVGSLEFRILATDRRAQYKSYIQRAKALPPEQTELKDDEGNRVAWWVPVAEGKDAEFRSVNYGTRYTTDRKGVKHLEVLVVNDAYEVKGEYLNRAFPSTDNQGKPCVAFVFNSIGAQKFSRLTGSHLPDPDQHFYYHLGIILDEKLVTAPRLKSAISDRGEISGGFDAERAKELVDVLNAGALPTALSPLPISERTTGPELGQDTIQRGKLSMVVSLGAVFLSVLVYYRFAGIVACTALAMNAILLLASMIIINAEFSLAGIAGFALSIGMAVDANVLIYERMREEAGRGAALRMTIRNGFERALSAIVDSNLTTLITAVILYAIGTDQVRGFAVTLFLGIVLSMYTAIIVARVIFDVADRQRWIDKVKMMRALPPTRFDFLRYKWVAIAISLSIIFIGLVATFARGRGILDIDFTGGVSVETVFRGDPRDPDKPAIGEVRKALDSAPELVSVQQLGENLVQSGMMSAADWAAFQKSQERLPSQGRPQDARQWAEALVESGKLTEDQATIVTDGRLPDVTVREITRTEGAEQGKGKTFIIDASNPYGENAEVYRELVKQKLKSIFGDELARNNVRLEGAAPIVAASGVERYQPALALAAPLPAPADAHAGPPLGARPELAALSAAVLAQTPPAKPAANADAAKKAPGAAATEPKPEVKPEPKPEAKSEPKPPPKPEAKPQPKAEAKTEPKAEAKPKPESAPAVVSPFAGGTKATLRFDYKIDHGTLEGLFNGSFTRQGMKPSPLLALTTAGYEEGSLERFDTWDVQIKLPPDRAKAVFEAVEKELQSAPFFPSSDTIGGEVAKQTRYRAIWALVASTFFILLYLWVRFQRVAYGLGAVVSLVHDVLVALACVAISYYLAPILGFLMVEPFKINIIMMTAFLTIAGYSLNDTIVIFDRIREVRGKAPQVTQEMINLSINQTLGRTLLTGLTSMMVIVVLYILGGPTIHGFAFAMIVGVITGTYSSIYIASPFLLWISRKREQRQRG